MRALKYFVVEAAASLWRGRRAALLAVLTIAGGLFVLGFFLALNTNLQRLVGRWSESAELSVYYKDDATPDQQRVVDELIAQSGLASNREFVSKQQAATRFRQDFPDLASSVERLDSQSVPGIGRGPGETGDAGSRTPRSTTWRQPSPGSPGSPTSATTVVGSAA